MSFAVHTLCVLSYQLKNGGFVAIPQLVTASYFCLVSHHSMQFETRIHTICKERDFAQISAGFVSIICVFLKSMHCVFYHIIGKMYSIISYSGRATNRWVSTSQLKARFQTKVKKQEFAPITNFCWPCLDYLCLLQSIHCVFYHIS